LRKLYDAYSLTVLPRLGEIVAKDRASYQYLVESIRRHPSQEELARIMRGVGLERVDWHNLCGGVVAVHRGYKL
jgi:ubiquinone/menaquinone biosynthesis C-methylase UbiE